MVEASSTQQAVGAVAASRTSKSTAGSLYCGKEILYSSMSSGEMLLVVCVALPAQTRAAGRHGPETTAAAPPRRSCPVARASVGSAPLLCWSLRPAAARWLPYQTPAPCHIVELKMALLAPSILLTNHKHHEKTHHGLRTRRYAWCQFSVVEPQALIRSVTQFSSRQKSRGLALTATPYICKRLQVQIFTCNADPSGRAGRAL
jgi:hypothetical protein